MGGVCRAAGSPATHAGDGSAESVVGGGDTIMAWLRTSLGHGADRVSIVYRRTRSELVVDEEELGETEREGVRMEFLASPIEILGVDGKVSGVMGGAGEFAVIVVEQHARLALALTRDAIVLDRGQVVHRSTSEALLGQPEILDRLVAVA